MKYIVILFLVVSVNRLAGQIGIVPLYGYQRGSFCDYAKPYGKTMNFKKNSSIDGRTFGVFLKILPLTSKINLYTGFYRGILTWGYKFFNPLAGEERGTAQGAIKYTFPVFINLFNSKIGQKKNTGNENLNKKSLRFKTYFGFSFDYIPFDEEYFNMGSDFNLGVGGSAPIAFNEYIHLITTKGASLLSGCSFYIYNTAKQKETFSLSILYWQGLVNLLGINVWYTIDSSSYYTKLFSRGTSLDLVLSYNIPVNYKGEKNIPEK